MLKGLPDSMDKERAHDTTFECNESGAMNSLGVFVGQEITRFNKLLAMMKQTLDDLIKAIKGTVVMSLDLESMFNRFLDNKVPESWERITIGYPSLKPLGSWMEDFLKRMEFMSDWLYNGPPNSFWLPAFFFPQGFMTASLQFYSRANQFPIDALVFQTHVQQIFREDVTEPPESGVNIHGIYIQGARWDFNLKSLEDSEPKKPIVPFPVIWLQPVPIKDLETERRYDCPLYKTSTRAGELSTTGHSTNFVLFLYLPTEVNKDYWIRRGTALLCMTDE